MSNLRHLSADELRAIIRESEVRRAGYRLKKADHETMADAHLKQAAALGKMDHDAAQRECWARLYLAQKE